MLPSLRLIVVGFLCGFVVVFAGLRMVASLHVVHGGLPIMAAHAATLPATGRYDPRETQPVPVLYDLRFVTGVVQPPPLNSPARVIERTFATTTPAPDPVTPAPARKDLVDAPAVLAAATGPEPLVVALAPLSVPRSEPAPVTPVTTAPLLPALAPAAQSLTAPAPSATEPVPAAEPPTRIVALPPEPAQEPVATEPPAAAAIAIPDADVPDLDGAPRASATDVPDLDGAPRTAAVVTGPVEETKSAASAPTAKVARKKRARVLRRAAPRAAGLQRQQRPVIYNGSASSYRQN